MPLGGFEQAREQLDERALAAAAAADDGDDLAAREVEVQALEDGGRFRAAVLETDVAQGDVAFERGHRHEARTVAALLRVGLEDVVEPVEQHVHHLPLVPQPEPVQIDPYASAVSELNATNPPTVTAPLSTWLAPTHRKSIVESRPMVCSTPS